MIQLALLLASCAAAYAAMRRFGAYSARKHDRHHGRHAVVEVVDELIDEHGDDAAIEGPVADAVWEASVHIRQSIRTATDNGYGSHFGSGADRALADFDAVARRAREATARGERAPLLSDLLAAVRSPEPGRS